MQRRNFIKLSSYLGGFTVLGGFSWLLQACKKMGMDMMGSYVNVIEGSFDYDLQVPNILSSNGFTLTAQSSTAQIIKGKSTHVLGYNNQLLGPTIKAMSGLTVNIQFENQLNEESSIHWHGFILPSNMDGLPQNAVASGGSFTYQFPIQQRAGTYWYHPHPHQKTAKQVFKGLGGLFIVNDSEESALGLPSGDFEVPLIIQDKRFYPDYSINYSPKPSEIMTGYLGDRVLVNGRYSPKISVSTKWYRFRILNGSNARVYNLALSNGTSFLLIGSDGGLLSNSELLNSILLAPGERLDILIDFSNYQIGTELFLISNTFSDSVQGSQSFKILKFTVEKQLSDSFIPPTTLSTISLIPQSSALKTRTFKIGGMSMNGSMMGNSSSSSMQGMHTINGKTYDMNRIDEVVNKGDTEIWIFDNSMGQEIHPIHVHGIQFQVIERIGGRGVILSSEKGWKDTVLCMANEQVKVIMTFPNSPGTFLLHCHNLEHEDDGMMLNYQIK